MLLQDQSIEAALNKYFDPVEEDDICQDCFNINRKDKE